MTLIESPSRLVMAGSCDPHEPAITKRLGDSMSVMTNQAFLKRFPGEFLKNEIYFNVQENYFLI